LIVFDDGFSVRLKKAYGYKLMLIFT